MTRKYDYQMREVSKDEFYKGIGNQNVTPYPTGSYPYTILFKTQLGDVRGVVEGSLERGIWPEKYRYLLAAAENTNE